LTPVEERLLKLRSAILKKIGTSKELNKPVEEDRLGKKKENSTQLNKPVEEDRLEKKKV